MKASQQSPPTADSPLSFDFDLEDWLRKLVGLNHPEWKRADGSCPECDREIQRMRERADAVQVLGLPEPSPRESRRVQRYGRSALPTRR